MLNKLLHHTGGKPPRQCVGFGVFVLRFCSNTLCDDSKLRFRFRHTLCGVGKRRVDCHIVGNTVHNFTIGKCALFFLQQLSQLILTTPINHARQRHSKDICIWIQLYLFHKMNCVFRHRPMVHRESKPNPLRIQCRHIVWVTAHRNDFCITKMFCNDLRSTKAVTCTGKIVNYIFHFITPLFKVSHL
ncbi:hypothetical protein SDC9_191918 [bioreactor metagenome]|uniref:Uncharacterized protein n=1 Tax=bioreactor metagenome TaxID=1076179 RepID=A0A645IAA6_9ZZZZ